MVILQKNTKYKIHYKSFCVNAHYILRENQESDGAPCLGWLPLHRLKHTNCTPRVHVCMNMHPVEIKNWMERLVSDGCATKNTTYEMYA